MTLFPTLSDLDCQAIAGGRCGNSGVRSRGFRSAGSSARGRKAWGLNGSSGTAQCCDTSCAPLDIPDVPVVGPDLDDCGAISGNSSPDPGPSTPDPAGQPLLSLFNLSGAFSLSGFRGGLRYPGLNS